MPKHLDNPLSVARRASEQLAKYCKQNNIKAMITGISGGLDSAVVLGIAAGAKAINPDLRNIGVRIPIDSSDDSLVYGEKVIKCFDAEKRTIDIYGAFADISNGIINPSDKKRKLRQGNIKARLRMIALYDIASANDGMVLSTDNYSEYLMGFWTLHGDVGDYGPCQMLWKSTEMYDLAVALGIPQEIIDAKPTDDLGVTDGGDEGQLGAPYEVVDEIMEYLITAGFNPNGSKNQLDIFQYQYSVLDEKFGLKVSRSLAERCLNSVFKRKGCINLTREQLGL